MQVSPARRQVFALARHGGTRSSRTRCAIATGVSTRTASYPGAVPTAIKRRQKADFPSAQWGHPSSGPRWPRALQCRRDSDVDPLQKHPAAAPIGESSTSDCARAARQRSACKKHEVAAAGDEAPEALMRRFPAFWPKPARALRLPRTSNSARQGEAPAAFAASRGLCQHLHLPSSRVPARASTHARSRRLRRLRAVCDQRSPAQPQRFGMRGPGRLLPGSQPSCE